MTREFVDFHEVGRLPAAGDNVAIAVRELEAGMPIRYGDATFTLSSTILVGHRFAVRSIASGEALTSWEMPFGTAIRPIAPGDYVCNAAVLNELSRRSLSISLPTEPNFADDVPPFVFDESTFAPAPPLALYDEQKTFLGYRRGGKRGVGTRNFIILLGTTSLTAGFVRLLETQLKPLLADYANIDGIVAVAHTEGGHQQPNNRDLLLRTLAGFVTHPNVGAVLSVDYGTEAVTNAMLRDYLTANAYPLNDVLHEFMSLFDSFQTSLDTASAIVKGWLAAVNAAQRTATPLTELKIALQCGGSDAFSGISGNPLAAWVAKEVIRCGGSANLAETDELVSAESYVLQKVRNIETARHFLETLARFKEWAGWHGHGVSGNPSGGNLLRGLYNVYLKSLGAAAKRDPDVRLDEVIAYGEPMREPGYYFMDSPGNDLESVAGQVASGCNMIFFVTGNGSITNFPFVPTLKIMTTTPRYNLLSNEMDVNAGRYLDGTPLEELGAETFDLSLEIASGKRSVGEQAGHAQVQIWRDWRQTNIVDIGSIKIMQTDGQPLPIKTVSSVPDVSFPVYRTPGGFASDQVGLIMPTSLCAGQISRMCAAALNDMGLGADRGISRYVALAHTEGCGFSGTAEYLDTLLGYITHPMVRHCLLLEHGCETTHNGYIRKIILDADLEPGQFGWASIQLDGGIEAVIKKVTDWFVHRVDDMPGSLTELVGLGAVRLGLVSVGGVPDDAALCLSRLARTIVTAGGTVILPEQDSLLASQTFVEDALAAGTPRATLNYAQHPQKQGLHVMQAPSKQWSETLTGLGGTGVELILAYTDDHALQSHPLVPVLPVSSAPQEDIDIILSGDSEQRLAQLINRMVDVLSRKYEPRFNTLGNVDFQITRGLLGVSL